MHLLHLNAALQAVFAVFDLVLCREDGGTQVFCTASLLGGGRMHRRHADNAQHTAGPGLQVLKNLGRPV